MIHGEDPKRQVVVKTGNKFRYMPAAFFGDDLVRHLWHKHYSKYLTDYSFEIDEDGKPWWVVTVSKPTIAWSGLKTLGVLIVDPTTGEDKFYELGKVPDWVDRVVPGSFVEDYLTWFGEYDRGWLNSWWGKKNVFEPETPSINYGADGQPYWVTCITSSNLRDASMIGVAYTNSRTGESVMYHAVGGTDEAVLDLVNNKVAFRKLHGSSPVLYNIYGVMTSIVPLLGESHTYQGVAYVNITDMVAAIGDTQEQALVAYQKTLATSGQQVAPEKRNDVRSVSEKVSRFAFVVKGTETVFYLRLEKVNKIFSGSEEVSPKLPLTAAGDMVTIRFVNSGEGVQPIVGFENYSIPVEESNLEKDLEAKVRARQAEAAAESATRSARGEIGNMSDEEVRKLMELKKSATPQ